MKLMNESENQNPSQKKKPLEDESWQMKEIISKPKGEKTPSINKRLWLNTAALD